MIRAIAAWTVAVAACGAKPAAAPARAEQTVTSDPVAPHAVEICDGWKALARRCPDLDRSEPDDECTRAYTAASFDPRTRRDADEIGRCVLGGGACGDVGACLHATNPSGLYAVTSYAVEPDCTSRAPGHPPRSPMVGKPAALPDLAAVRGSPVLVTFTATWESTAIHELRLLSRLTGAKVVVVLSNTPSEVAELKAPALHLVADAPLEGQTLGPITQAWQVSYVPESFLVDAAGVVRQHFAMMHDWASPGAAACMRSVGAR